MMWAEGLWAPGMWAVGMWEGDDAPPEPAQTRRGGVLRALPPQEDEEEWLFPLVYSFLTVLENANANRS